MAYFVVSNATWLNTTAKEKPGRNHLIWFSGCFPRLGPLLDGFVDVFICSNHPHIILAVDLQQLYVKEHYLINRCSFWGLHVTVLVLVAILWFDCQLTSLLKQHVCSSTWPGIFLALGFM